MSGELRTRFELLVVGAFNGIEREAALALLLFGATSALARCMEIDGYDWEARIKAIQRELIDGEASAPHDEVPAAAPPLPPLAPPENATF